MKYKRVLLKVSGEALSGKTPIDFEKATETALQIKALHDAGCRTWVSIEPYRSRSRAFRCFNGYVYGQLFRTRSEQVR